MPKKPRLNFTPTETAALAGWSTKGVYKETREVCGRASASGHRAVGLGFPTLVYLSTLEQTGLELPIESRRSLYRKIEQGLDQSAAKQRSLEFAPFLTLNLREIASAMTSRINEFERWKRRLVTDPGIQRGATVFPNSRLPVRIIGDRLEFGWSRAEITEDYPYLTKMDLDFAQLYVKAYPNVGRPPKRHQVPDR